MRQNIINICRFEKTGKQFSFMEELSRAEAMCENRQAM